MDKNTNNNSLSKSALVGIIIILLGILLFLKNLLPDFPNFILSWPSILIIVGVIIGIKTNFKNILSVILIVVGTFALIHNYFYHISFYKALILPATIITIGCMIIIKGKSKKTTLTNDQNDPATSNPTKAVPETHSPITYDFTSDKNNNSNEDYNLLEEFLTSNSYFGSQKQVVYSKNLKKGDFTCVFGSADINFRQADFNNEIIIDVLVVCGSLELKMPSNWYLKNELTSILGGIEDKRNTYNVTPDFNKRIVLKGVVLLGGIEIKN